MSANASSSRSPQRHAAAATPPRALLSIPAKARLSRELQRLQTDPPPGIAAFLKQADDCDNGGEEDDLSAWKAEIVGPPNSPFEDGVFELRVKFPFRYPMEPPSCQFTSNSIPHHPNIDAGGRICLDTLKSPPAGTWSPAVSFASLLLSLQSLLAEPNPDDGLVPEISQQYRLHPDQWQATAREQTKLMMEQRTAAATTKTQGKRSLAYIRTKEDNNTALAQNDSAQKRQRKEPPV